MTAVQECLLEAAEAANRPRLRIGSLFSGYGGLDMAVCDVLGAEVAWHCQFEPPDKKGREDKHQAAARILAHHWPDVPNHGDVTAVDWSAVAPVDVVTGGFPCGDLSVAGLGAGMFPGTRSGLWFEMARAIAALRPRLVVIENVPGILHREADRGLGTDAEDLDPTSGARRILLALGAVLGDLASLGFDAEWASVRASDIGAAHKRERIFILAWPAATDPADLRHERSWGTRERRTGPANRGVAAADPTRVGRREGRPEPARIEGRLDVAVGRGSSAADPDGDGRQIVQRQQPRLGTRNHADRRGEDGGGLVDWGKYGPAIHRAEEAFGRPAPRPADDHGRLSAAFDEWHMGLPAGHVTAVPGIPRAQQIKALGNGVVPAQAAHALRILLDRAPEALPALPALDPARST